MDANKIVGEKIRILRENKSITAEELAERSGLALEQVERIENNIDIPSLAPLIKIARVLGCASVLFLMTTMKPVLWYAARMKLAKPLVSPTTLCNRVSTWSIIPRQVQKQTGTWNPLLLT